MRVFRLDDEHPLTGWHMLAIVLTFFGVVIAVNVAMAIAASGTFPGLVVENSYVASQHYDELLEKADEQDRKGWGVRLSSAGGILRLALSDAGGAPVRRLAVGAHIGRPSTTREDRNVAFSLLADGSYESQEALPPGLWEVDLEARRGEELVFRQTREIFVRPAAAGARP
jgi:nitrogen fixation protein FixH